MGATSFSISSALLGGSSFVPRGQAQIEAVLKGARTASRKLRPKSTGTGMVTVILESEHLAIVEEVFKPLSDAGLAIAVDKCRFGLPFLC